MSGDPRSCAWCGDGGGSKCDGRCLPPQTQFEKLQAENRRLRAVIEEYERDRLNRLGGIGSPQ